MVSAACRRCTCADSHLDLHELHPPAQLRHDPEVRGRRQLRTPTHGEALWASERHKIDVRGRGMGWKGRQLVVPPVFGVELDSEQGWSDERGKGVVAREKGEERTWGKGRAVACLEGRTEERDADERQPPAQSNTSA